MARTLYDKIWDAHLIDEPKDGTCLIYIDRHLVHEVTSPQAFDGLRVAKRPVRRPDLTLVVADHNVPTTDRSAGITEPESRLQVETLEQNVKDFALPHYFGMNDVRQGIVHIIGPEQGFTIPGTTLVCGDSHTATHGAFGCLAFGIGTTEVEHVLATQTMIQRRAKNMLIRVEGELPFGIAAKDVILAIIGKIGTAGGTGHVIEYAGSTIRGLSIEGRMTVCNMSIEAGARAGLIAPDDKTYAYLMGRPMAPKGAKWEAALAYWKTLPSDPGAKYDREVVLEAKDIAPQVTWGTSPQDVLPITGAVPDPAAETDDYRRRSMERSLEYMDLEAGDEARRDRGAARLHRLLHQQPDRGSARRRGGGQGPQGRGQRQRARRAGLGPGQASGGRGRARQDLPRSRLRMARGRLLDVPRHECRQARARRALRLDLEPQFRGPPGPRRAHPSRQPGDGRRRRGRGPPDRRARARLGAQRANVPMRSASSST